MKLHEIIHKVKEGYHIRRPNMYEHHHLGGGICKGSFYRRTIIDGKIVSGGSCSIDIDDIEANDWEVSKLPRLVLSQKTSTLVFEGSEQ